MKNQQLMDQLKEQEVEAQRKDQEVEAQILARGFFPVPAIEKQIQRYAEMCKCTHQQAEIRVKIFNEMQKEKNQASICPTCEEPSLKIESMDSEIPSGSWVECTECGFTHDITKQYEPLVDGYDFDVVLAFAATDLKERPLQEVEEYIGCSWEEFVKQEMANLLQSDGWRIGIQVPKK